MFDIIKESFKITNKYIVLATPLILFSLIASLYILFSASGKVLSIIFALILFFLMLCTFLSGWFFMVKKCVSDQKTDNMGNFIKTFPEGVGEYFLPVCGLVLFTFFISAFITCVSYFAGIKWIGDITDTYKALMDASVSAEALKSFIVSLPVDKLIKLGEWNILLFFTAVFTYFLIMFYSPALFFKNKNPLLAFFISLRDLFGRKFIKNVILFISILFIYLCLSLITSIAGNNIVVRFILTLANFYYIVFAAVYVYNYYYKNFIQIGGNVDMIV